MFFSYAWKTNWIMWISYNKNIEEPLTTIYCSSLWQKKSIFSCPFTHKRKYTSFPYKCFVIFSRKGIKLKIYKSDSKIYPTRTIGLDILKCLLSNALPQKTLPSVGWLFLQADDKSPDTLFNRDNQVAHRWHYTLRGDYKKKKKLVTSTLKICFSS